MDLKSIALPVLSLAVGAIAFLVAVVGVDDIRKLRFLGLPKIGTVECQVAVIFYSFAAAVIAYNLGYWMSWYDFFTGDDEKERQDRNTTFSGQHYLGEPGERMEMVMIARRDLNMTPGLLATQCCHAGVALYKKVRVKNAGIVQSWEESSQRKVVLFTPNEPSLVALQKALREKGVPTTFIRDKKEEFDGKGKLVMGNRSMCAVLGPPSLLRPILGECDIVE